MAIEDFNDFLSTPINSSFDWFSSNEPGSLVSTSSSQQTYGEVVLKVYSNKYIELHILPNEWMASNSLSMAVAYNPTEMDYEKASLSGSGSLSASTNITSQGARAILNFSATAAGGSGVVIGFTSLSDSLDTEVQLSSFSLNNEALSFTFPDLNADFSAYSNSAPVAQDSSASGEEDTLITGQLQATDADDDVLTFTAIQQPSNGALNLNTDGSYSYQPNAGFSGSDSFGFSVSDGQVSDTGLVSLTIIEGAAPETAGAFFDFSTNILHVPEVAVDVGLGPILYNLQFSLIPTVTTLQFALDLNNFSVTPDTAEIANSAFSGTTGMLSIPQVEVGEQSFAIELVLIGSPDGIVFELATATVL